MCNFNSYGVATGNHRAIWIAASNHSAIWIAGSIAIDLVTVLWMALKTTVNIMWQLVMMESHHNNMRPQVCLG